MKITKIELKGYNQFKDVVIYRMGNTVEYPYFYFDWDSKIEELDFFQLLRGNFKKINSLLFNFPTEVITGDNGHEDDGSDTLEMLDKVIAVQVSPYMNKLNLGRSIDFAVGDVNKILGDILEDIKKHQEQELLFNNQIASAASPKDAARKKSEFNKWLEQNPKYPGEFPK
jgi:hypothetical protein